MIGDIRERENKKLDKLSLAADVTLYVCLCWFRCYLVKFLKTITCIFKKKGL